MRNNRWINFVPYLIVILALFSLANMNTGTSTQNLTYTEFQNLVEQQKVTESSVTVGDNVIQIRGVYEEDGRTVNFTASVPRSEAEVNDLMEALQEANVSVSDANESNLLVDMLISLVPFVIFGAMAFFLISRMTAAATTRRLNSQNPGPGWKATSRCVLMMLPARMRKKRKWRRLSII